jgi:hypothetical protein
LATSNVTLLGIYHLYHLSWHLELGCLCYHVSSGVVAECGVSPPTAANRRSSFTVSRSYLCTGASSKVINLVNNIQSSAHGLRERLPLLFFEGLNVSPLRISKSTPVLRIAVLATTCSNPDLPLSKSQSLFVLTRSTRGCLIHVWDG